MAEAFRVPAELVGGKQEREEVARNVEEVLAWLDDCDTRGTFFVLGRIAKQQPDVVRSIAQAGHEIGSHSFHHLRLYNQDPAGLREAISASRQALEDAAGVPVLGFRAPDFSINAETLHILDQILEAGYTYDSSIFPIEGHDVYGVPGAQREIHRLGNGLVEFPPATVRMLGRTLPVLGGGYFRLLPLSASRLILRRKRDEPTMLYTHPYELGSAYPRIEGMSATRRFRHYVNIDKSRDRFSELFRSWEFGPAIDILREKEFL